MLLRLMNDEWVLCGYYYDAHCLIVSSGMCSLLMEYYAVYERIGHHNHTR